VEHAARPELLLELRIFWIVRVLRFLLGVQVIEIAEELVEAVRGRKKLVAVAEVVLSELAADVAERLEKRRRWSDLPVEARGRRPGDRPWSTRCGLATGR
jgi:hypothetical protein